MPQAQTNGIQLFQIHWIKQFKGSSQPQGLPHIKKISNKQPITLRIRRKKAQTEQ